VLDDSAITVPLSSNPTITETEYVVGAEKYRLSEAFVRSRVWLAIPQKTIEKLDP
jgi:hypothetical protein